MAGPASCWNIVAKTDSTCGIGDSLFLEPILSAIIAWGRFLLTGKTRKLFFMYTILLHYYLFHHCKILSPAGRLRIPSYYSCINNSL